MPRGTRIGPVSMVAGVTVIWYLIVLVWAVRPLSGMVTVGTDHSGSSAETVTVEVECNNLFAGDAGDGGAIPDLPAQPEGHPPLALPAEPCQFLQSDARRAFVIDTVTVVVVLAGAVVVSRKLRGSHSDHASRIEERTSTLTVGDAS